MPENTGHRITGIGHGKTYKWPDGSVSKDIKYAKPKVDTKAGK